MSNSKDAVRKILDTVKADKRTSLTAPEGKLVCDAYGIAVPKEGVAKSAAEAAKFWMSWMVMLSAVAVIAIGTSANPIVQSTTPGLNTNKRNYIEADPMTQRTSRKGVFAGGDIVTGSATVILAMGAGRRAAKSIHEYLTSPGAW